LGFDFDFVGGVVQGIAEREREREREKWWGATN